MSVHAFRKTSSRIWSARTRSVVTVLGCYPGRKSSQKNCVGAPETADVISGMCLTQIGTSPCIEIRAL